MSDVACAVALPLPTHTPYWYTVPAALRDRVRPGARVLVPVKNRELVGIVLAVDGSPRDDVQSLRPVLLAPDPAPLLSQALLDLAAWIGRYYACPVGLALRAMVPGALWGGSRLVASLASAARGGGGSSGELLEVLAKLGGRAPAGALARRMGRPVWSVLQRLARAGAVTLETEPASVGPTGRKERVLVLARALPTLLQREAAFGRAKRQREVYEALDAAGGEASVRHLREQLGFSAAVLRALVDRGLARWTHEERPRDPFADVKGERPARPTPAQARAIAELQGLPKGGALVVHGVTGSGKTLVYLEAARPAVEDGQGAIILVPEIALTPQTIARVRGAFGDTVAVVHSGLSDLERADAFRQLSNGAKRVAVGARSAVFAPVRRLAWLVLDEEHDASYKNNEAPRYHARDVALRRARLEGARVVLGSATPSLETWGARDRISVVQLPDRVTARPLPPVTLVDLRSAPRVPDARGVPWSTDLDEGVERALAAGDQVLLLLNRRGFAHYLQCQACGHVWECGACSIALTVHQRPARLRCHYCGHDEAIPQTCPRCGGEAQRTRGVGTQALERWLAERYPAARLARMDADTTSRKWAHQGLLEAVARREVDILFGTQMIAKGLDFPDVTLVGVVDADTGLHLPDFRAAERTFQLVAQVAGRAGRGPRGGRVVVQTRQPDHPALAFAARHDYVGFAEHELAQRRAPAYPPHVALANVVVSGLNAEHVAAAAVEVAQWVEGLVAARAPGQVELVGPAPAPLARIKRRWRWHFVLRAPDRRWLGGVVRYTARRAPHTGRGAIRVIVDRDPVSLL